jgi:hypothetical protein
MAEIASSTSFVDSPAGKTAAAPPDEDEEEPCSSASLFSASLSHSSLSPSKPINRRPTSPHSPPGRLMKSADAL